MAGGVSIRSTTELPILRLLALPSIFDLAGANFPPRSRPLHLLSHPAEGDEH